nr:hypothetical protein [Candidatus Omnitrophota bacterium]
MYILTIHEDSNANITLFHNSDIIFSVAEERLTRIKHKGGFPEESLKFILNKFNLSLKDITIVLCGNKYHPLPRILGNSFPTFEHPFLGIGQKISLYYHHALFKSAIFRNMVESLNNALLKYKLGKNIFLTDHHTAHAYSAYMTSGFNKALTITTDNFGDGLSSAVFTCENGKCNFLYGSSALNSPGQFYGEISQILGFHPLMAGKMTGLAAYGNPDNAYNVIKNLFSLHNNKKDFVLPPLLFKSKSLGLFRELRNYSKEDIAASAQKRFEEVMLEYIKEAVRITKIPNIAFAGGVYGNVRLNQKISELEEVKEIFIHPAMTDQGISLGVGLKYLAENMSLKPFKLKNVYWGPDYNNDEIEKTIKSSNMPYEYHQDIEKITAQLLSIGKVVARFSGKLEYGPRALGNRSILYQTTDKTVNDWLNK